MSAETRKPKPKKCKVCKEFFSPWISTMRACSPECALVLVREEQEKKKRKELKQRKEKLKSRSDWLREAQAEFNKFIRLRDKNEPCISCGRFHNGQYHAGHYRTVGGNPELRFEELNCHKQCSVCNNHKSGNIVEYRINLARKIGEEALAWLEGPHDPLKLTIDEIKELKAKYKAKCREIEKDD